MTEVNNQDCNQKSTSKIQICINDLMIAYQNNVAIFDINLDINENDFIGICGPNGSGKSSLLKAITGAIKPVKGKIHIFGEDINKGTIREIRSKIGYLPQQESIDRNFPALVEDVVGMGLYSQLGFFKGLSSSDKEKIEEVLEIVGMEKLAKRPIGHLSGGQQQKVRIARALINDPSILLIDEPFTGLDFKIAKNIADLLGKIYRERDITIIMISHSISLIKELCNRVVCLNRRIIWEGKPASPMFDKTIKEVFF